MPDKRRSLRVLFWTFFLLLAAATAIVNFVKSSSTARFNSCINNLRQIEGAKNSWALENKLTNGAPSQVTAISKYIRGEPKCPSGGSYSFNPVDTAPECSVHGHPF